MQQHLKQIPVYLLAVVFFGLGGLGYFLKLLPEPKLEGLSLDYMKVLGGSGYMTAIKVLELIGGLLLFIPRTRAIGLCIIVPIAINIFFFEIFIAKEVGIGAALLALSAAAIYFNKERFAGILGK